MTTTQLISGIRERGGDLVWDGERVVFRGAQDLLTPRLLDSLKSHKEKLVKLLADAPSAEAFPSAEAHTEDKASDPRIAGLTIADFAGSRRTLRLWSEVLGCEILLAADNAEIAESETRTVYRAREMGALIDLSPEGLSLLHQVKTSFGGDVQPEEGYVINEALSDRDIDETDEYNQAAADVLDVLAKAACPVPHPQIVKSLILRGHSKMVAREAIAHCQTSRWIYHNLETGYEMSEEQE